jgi:uncharacterized protein
VQSKRGATNRVSKSFFHSRASRFTDRVFVLFLAVALFSAGCKKEQPKNLSPRQVHEITREMMRAAGSFGRQPGNIASHLQFDGTHSDRADQLFVTLPPGSSDQARRESLARLIQSLDRIATANNLTRDAETSSGALLRLNYRRAGMITQSIHIIAPISPNATASVSPSAGAESGAAPLAIILDDLGSDRAAAEAIFALPYRLTISVLPNHAHSTDIAEEAHRRGYEVMLHLPMQSVGNETPEDQELHPGMPADAIPLLFEQMMQSVPYASGVNNHQGSQATADPALMGELMPILRQWNLFYVDSRTTAATVAYDTAQSDGVRSGFRNVPFLDDVAETSAVRKQLELALRGAREKRGAIAIGHPHRATLQALSEVLPTAKARGIQLVYASDLVH